VTGKPQGLGRAAALQTHAQPSSQWEYGISDQIDYKEQCPGLPIER
jgi:hypothetical protein